jgi:hypothetical protein
MRRICYVLFSVMMFSMGVFAQGHLNLSPVDSALNFLGLRETDFVSDRVWMDDDTFLLPKIRDALNSPMSAAAISKAFSAAVPNSVSEAGRVNDMADFIAAKCPDVACRDIDAQLAAAKPTSVDPFEPMLSAFALAEGYRVQAFARLNAAQQKVILQCAPLWFGDEDNSATDSLRSLLNRAFNAPYDTASTVKADSVLTLLSLVNRDALSAAIYAFARGLAVTVDSWKTTKSPFAITQVQGADGLILASRETPYGTFVLGGSGPNTYSGDFALIIDLGGDDRYTNRAGGAAAGLGHTLAAVIDMGGNDEYVSAKAVNQACGVMGIGALVDLNGNDIYRGGAFCQGAAFCGAGLFFDGGGNDLYQAGIFSQSAAVCGVSVLVDGGGRDVYDVAEFGQAYASTFGAAALLDRSGNDVYRAGGSELHAPLRPEDFRSMAQGFAIGSRPRAGGGIALLHDESGNDFYNAEIYAQGVGYWYSLGALLDDAGNDVYNATQYAQGAGIHLAAGVLEDGGGDDRYGSRFGPGQGAAHDLSVGYLVDRNGDDQYTISGGHGMAINNSAALFFDAAGNDAYFVTEKSLGQGGVSDARGFGNLGVFVDGEGRDTYGTPGEMDSVLWLRGNFAVGYDIPSKVVRPREAPVDTNLVPQDTLRAIPDLFRDAAKWEVTDNREIVRRARIALKARGIFAVQWVAEHKLNSQDALEFRAIAELFKAYPDSAAKYLQNALDSDSRDQRRNAIGLFSEMKYKPAAEILLKKLHDPSFEKLHRQLLYALGEIKDKSATGLLMEFARSSVEKERIAALVSLGKIGDDHGWPDIFNHLKDPSLAVREAAVQALAAQNADVLGELQSQLGEDDVYYQELLLLATARMAERWKNDNDLKKSLPKLATIAKKYLEHPIPRLDGAALLIATQTLDGKELNKHIARLQMINDPVLSARIRQVQQNMR